MEHKAEETKSKFNAGLAKLERISELRKGIHDARISSDINKWFACLNGIRSEINSKLSKVQRHICATHLKNVHISINENNSAAQRSVRRTTDPKIALYNYELYIGELEESTGMGMPEDDDDGL